MLLKLILLVPSVFSLALCAYLLTGIMLYFRALYKTAHARATAQAPHARIMTSHASSEIEAIPAT